MGGEERKAEGVTCNCYENHRSKIECERDKRVKMHRSIAAK
jgi:hypothetical protein